MPLKEAGENCRSEEVLLLSGREWLDLKGTCCLVPFGNLQLQLVILACHVPRFNSISVLLRVFYVTKLISSSFSTILLTSGCQLLGL